MLQALALLTASLAAAQVPGPGFFALPDASSVAGAPAPGHRAVSVRERVEAELAGSGVPASYADAAFADARLAIDPSVIPQINKPGESLPYSKYRLIFMSEARIAAGAQFYAARKPLLAQVAARYGVDPLLLTALVGVETYYGRGTGTHVVFNALYTIADRVPQRRGFADRELSELLKLCYFDRCDAFAIKGSYAGAFGYGQFIPSTFNRYAVDFDGDGLRRYDQWPDALATIANYLVRNGYAPDAAGTYRAVYAYNHSDNYVRVVLELRDAVAGRVTP